MNNKMKDIGDSGDKMKVSKDSEITRDGALNAQVEDLLSLLDQFQEVPDGLSDKVLEAREPVSVERVSAWDFSKYLQIAAVFAAAVMIGVLMGKNLNMSALSKKDAQRNQVLIELRHKHHLSDTDSFMRL